MNTKQLPDLFIYDECGALEIMRKAAEVLDNAGRHNKAKEMCYRVALADDKYVAQAIIEEYVNIIDMSSEEEYV